MSTMSDVKLSEMVRSIVPALGPNLHKGQCGKIGVVGGCQQYTGAPYFAAISAMKVFSLFNMCERSIIKLECLECARLQLSIAAKIDQGADLGYVFCTKDAAPVIKSYSPELIVYPVLDDIDAVTKISEVLPKLHCVVIGPGLGRDNQLLENVKGVIEKVRILQLPLVIDADGVFLLCQEPKIIAGYTKAILTPNAVEFSHLFSAVTGAKSCDLQAEVQELSRSLGNVTVVRKGVEDIIANSHHTLVCSAGGSYRRCGGQGDLLAGSMGTFSHWSHSTFSTQQSSNQEFLEYGPTLSAAYAACLLTRHCAKRAYEANRRSTMTTDLISKICEVFNEDFEQHT